MNQDVFEKYSVPKAMMTLAVPTMLSMLVTIFYNMADTFFVGQTGDPNQVAAVSVTTPIFLLLMAVGNMFGIGGSSYISRLLGAGDRKRIKNVSSFCCYGSIIAGLLMMVVFLVGMRSILEFVGTSENTYEFAKEYLTIIGYGSVFVVFSSAFGNIVRGEGAAKEAMIGMMIGTVINIILDPVMILVLDMGVEGAAYATIIGNMGASAYYVYYFLRKKTLLSISIKELKIKEGIMTSVLSVGLPASINNILMSISNVILNVFLVTYGDVPVAAMGIAQKANMLVILLNIGLATGIQPLIGYYYGARRTAKLKKTMKYGITATVLMGTVITIGYFIFSKQIIAAFISDTAVIQNGVKILEALMLSGPVIGIMFIFNFSFQAMGKAGYSLVLSLGRQGLFFLPILYIANKLVGLDGVIFAQPAADYAAILISVFMFMRLRKELKHLEVEDEEQLTAKQQETYAY